MMYKIFYSLLLFGIALLTGCSGHSQDINATTQKNPQVIMATDTTGKIETQPIDNALLLDSNTLTELNTTAVNIEKTYDIAQNDKNKPLFIDGLFKGIIKNVKEIDSNQSQYILGDANSIDEVYDSIELDMSADQILAALTKSMKKVKGKYDHLNPDNPISFSVYKKRAKVVNGNAPVEDDVYLDINIPQGYRMEKTVRTYAYTETDIKCDFYITDCAALLSSKYQRDFDLGMQSDKSDSKIITYSTKPSKISINIGSNVRIHYIHNKYQLVSGHNSDDYLFFQFYTKGDLTSDLHFSIIGEGESEDYTIEWEITDGFDLEIVHAGSLVAKTIIHFQPAIELGVSGSIVGQIEAYSKIKREGDYAFTYENTIKKLTNEKTFSYQYKFEHDTDELDEHGIKAKLKAEATAWIYPNIKVSPQVRFARVLSPVSLGQLRSGFKIETNLEGQIGSDYQVKADNIDTDLDANVSLALRVYPLLDGKISVNIGTTNFYSSGDKTFYAGEGITIFDWFMKILDPPKIIENNHKVIFAIEEDDEEIKSKIKIYYTKDGTFPYIDDEHKGYLWEAGDGAVSLEEGEEIWVVAVLFNDDISDGIWSFGVSISDVAKKKGADSNTEVPHVELDATKGSSEEHNNLSTAEATPPKAANPTEDTAKDSATCQHPLKVEDEIVGTGELNGQVLKVEEYYYSFVIYNSSGEEYACENHVVKRKTYYPDSSQLYRLETYLYHDSGPAGGNKKTHMVENSLYYENGNLKDHTEFIYSDHLGYGTTYPKSHKGYYEDGSLKSEREGDIRTVEYLDGTSATVNRLLYALFYYEDGAFEEIKVYDHNYGPSFWGVDEGVAYHEKWYEDGDLEKRYIRSFRKAIYDSNTYVQTIPILSELQTRKNDGSYTKERVEFVSGYNGDIYIYRKTLEQSEIVTVDANSKDGVVYSASKSVYDIGGSPEKGTEFYYNFQTEEHWDGANTDQYYQRTQRIGRKNSNGDWNLDPLTYQEFDNQMQTREDVLWDLYTGKILRTYNYYASGTPRQKRYYAYDPYSQIDTSWNEEGVATTHIKKVMVRCNDGIEREGELFAVTRLPDDPTCMEYDECGHTTYVRGEECEDLVQEAEAWVFPDM